MVEYGPEHAITAGGVAARLTAVLLLVLLNGFFVAAEFALVALRRSRIDLMASEGDGAARVVRKILPHVDRYIAATRVGITLATLALGWIGERTVAALIDAALGAAGRPVATGAAHSMAAVLVAFGVIAFLHIVFGELAPRSLALARPEGVARLLGRPLRAFTWMAGPGIRLVDGSAGRILRWLGVEPAGDRARAHSPEELRLIVMQARAHGTLDESDSAMLAGVFDFHEKRARDVMRPRTGVVGLDIECTEDEVWEVLRSERYSRYPVYEENLDNVVGVFLAKDFWLRDPSAPFSLAAFVREALFIPDTRRAELALDDLRKTRAHLAVVLDEYGGTAGILTLEDLVEEVIGDINDEYDMAARDAFESDGVLELAGTLSMVDARSDYRLPIPEGDWSTLGGYAFARIGRVPKIGDRAPFPGGELEVVAMDGRRVAALRVLRTA